MDKRFFIIHQSEIVRMGLWAILRESFHNEFILLKDISAIADYSGFSNKEILIFIEHNLYDSSVINFITKNLGDNNKIQILQLINDRVKEKPDFLSLYESSNEINFKVKSLFKKKVNATSIVSELSIREKDVLRQVAMGLTNKEIADVLFISIHTVITHRKHITNKLGIKSISGLTVYAILNKLIDTENIDPTTLI